MMNLNKAVNLDQLVELMDEDLIYQRIIRPLDNAFVYFSLPYINHVTHEVFNSILSDFFQHINQYGPNTRKLSKDEALQEGMWFLERYYQSTKASGYDAAYLDAIQISVDYVLEQIIEFMKSVEKGKYLNWIFTTIVDPMEWDLKRKIAEEIVERFSHLFAPDVRIWSIGQLVNNLEMVVKMVI